MALLEATVVDNFVVVVVNPRILFLKLGQNQVINRLNVVNVVVVNVVVSIVVVVVHPRSLILKFVEIGSVTAEILLTLSLRDGGGGRWIKVTFVSHPIFESS